MMQKILLLINAHLNDTFQGLEEGKFECNLGCAVSGRRIVSDKLQMLQKLHVMKLGDYWFHQERIRHLPWGVIRCQEKSQTIPQGGLRDY